MTCDEYLKTDHYRDNRVEFHQMVSKLESYFRDQNNFYNVCKAYAIAMRKSYDMQPGIIFTIAWGLAKDVERKESRYSHRFQSGMDLSGLQGTTHRDEMKRILLARLKAAMLVAMEDISPDCQELLVNKVYNNIAYARFEGLKSVHHKVAKCREELRLAMNADELYEEIDSL